MLASERVTIKVTRQTAVLDDYKPDRESAKRLDTGKIKIAGKLDLHGMTQTEAHAALTDFILTSVRAGRRCVLVVTGKGSATKPAVLKANVPRWLATLPLKQHIAGMQEAGKTHGGAGALYVLLKR